MLFLIVLLSLSSFAEEECTTPAVNNTLADCIASSVAIVSKYSDKDDSAEATLAATSLFMSEYHNKTDFDPKSAHALIARLKKFANSDKESNKVRSKLWLLTSGVHGRLADKLRANGGAEQGKFALQSLKKSLSFDKTNKDAAIAYATTITNLGARGFVAKKFIENALEVKLSNEVKTSLKSMEEAGLTSHPLYSQLKTL